MSVTLEDSWEAPPLDAADQRLADAYEQVGHPLDSLPYTPEFEQLFARVSRADTSEERNRVWRRLLTLRKMGRLPRLSFAVE